MDILIVAAAIFGVSSLLSRYHQPLFTFSCPPLCVPDTQLSPDTNKRLLCVTKPHVYSRDCLKALQPLTPPPPDPHALLQLAIHGIYSELVSPCTTHDATTLAA